jgi:hypothetical protein
MDVLEGVNIELVEWDPDNVSTLKYVFEGCTASLFVPPIHNRIEVM